MYRQTLTVAPTNAAANNICTSQTPGAAGPLTLNGALVAGGVATAGAAQLVTITSAGNDSGNTFTLTGTDADGGAQTETITGPNTTTVTGVKYFKTVTIVSIGAAAVGALTVGVAANSVSPTLKSVKEPGSDFNMGVGVAVTGTITYSIQHTYDDTVKLATYPVTWFTHGTITAKSAAFDGAYSQPVMGLRIIVTASTTGTATAAFVQSSSI